MVKAVREVVKTHETQKRDMYDDTAEILKPSIESQKEIKKSIDEKQDKVIEQLQKNQEDLAEGINKFTETNLRAIAFKDELPKAITFKDELPEAKREPSILDIDNNFNKTDRIILNNYKLSKPGDLTQMLPQKLSEEKIKAAELAKTIGRKKGQKNTSDEDKKSYDIELQTLSPGTVTCILLCLHVCYASTVTAAFRDPIFFSELAAYANGARYVIACFFFCTLVASLLHSGFLLALGFRVPRFFSV